MTYHRVIPRDLFNEGNLLTCLGRLVIKLEERRGHGAAVGWVEYRLDRFDVEQDESDGSIDCVNVTLTLRERYGLRLFRPLNARDKWPLWCRIDDEDVRVFDLDGDLSPEFWALIGGQS